LFYKNDWAHGRPSRFPVPGTGLLSLAIHINRLQARIERIAAKK